MNQRSEEGLFEVLERILKASPEPLDCVELYNQHAEVRERASNPNRVSDYLGNLWRKGKLIRLPAPRGENNKARWLYAWKGKAPAKKPRVEEGMVFDTTLNTVLNKPNLSIEDDGRRIIITMPDLTITIEQHKD